jgi:predicted nuclease of predicted toxin-antitoxin system
MRFLLDMNLPLEMAEWLQAEGHDVVHVREIGLAQSSDRNVFTRAAEDARIVVTFNLDFGEIAGLIGATSPGVVLLASEWPAGIICGSGSAQRLRKLRRH